MRLLIVGAGIGGLTLTALLNKRGVSATVIEKAHGFDEAGYMLGLYPLGSNILHGLDCYDTFIAQTEPVNNYSAYNFDGKKIKSFTLKSIAEGYGHYQNTTRFQLLELLYQACQDKVIFNRTVQSLTQNDHQVQVTFSDGTKDTFDLVVGADGMHSKVRECILTPDEVDTFDTKWGGFVWWGKAPHYPTGEITEYWGKERFFGIYPVNGQLGLIAATPKDKANKAIKKQHHNAFIQSSFNAIFDKYPSFKASLPDEDKSVFFWPLLDKQAKHWHKGRVLLLGDAACGFLPTAGVGASMAMESAAVLNDILSRSDKTLIPRAIDFFEKRRKKRVIQAQQDSRRLAKMMFVKSAWASHLRDTSVKLMSVKSLLNSITKSFDTPL